MTPLETMQTVEDTLLMQPNPSCVYIQIISYKMSPWQLPMVKGAVDIAGIVSIKLFLLGMMPILFSEFLRWVWYYV